MKRIFSVYTHNNKVGFAAAEPSGQGLLVTHPSSQNPEVGVAEKLSHGGGARVFLRSFVYADESEIHKEQSNSWKWAKPL